MEIGYTASIALIKKECRVNFNLLKVKRKSDSVYRGLIYKLFLHEYLQLITEDGKSVDSPWLSDYVECIYVYCYSSFDNMTF